MSDLPEGVERIEVGGESRLATEGSPVYGEPTRDGWRVWAPGRSKVAAMLDLDLPVALGPDATVLYLGAGAGTTVSHLADVCRVVYAVEFAPQPVGRLYEVADDRPTVIPLLKDARTPTSYAHVVESGCDLLVQDVATRGQAEVALANRRFLADDGQLVLAVKARSEDVVTEPEAVFDDVLDQLADGFVIEATATLEPYHADHLGVLARPR